MDFKSSISNKFLKLYWKGKDNLRLIFHQTSIKDPPLSIYPRENINNFLRGAFLMPKIFFPLSFTKSVLIYKRNLLDGVWRRMKKVREVIKK